MITVWYSIVELGDDRRAIDISEEVNLENPREVGEVLQACAAKYYTRVRHFPQVWPLRFRLYESDDMSVEPITCMEVDMELLPSFIAYTHTASPR